MKAIKEQKIISVIILGNRKSLIKDTTHRTRLHILLLFVAANRSVLVQFVGELFLEFDQQIHFEFSISVNFAFYFLVLGQRLLDAVFGVQLRVLAVVDVLKHLERNVHILYLVLDFFNLLQPRN